MKNTPSDGECKNVKIKLTPKPAVNRDFTPPLMRPEEGNAKKAVKASPVVTIEVPVKEKVSTYPEKLVSPRKLNEAVLEPFNANIVAGHGTPGQNLHANVASIKNATAGNNNNVEARSASANKKIEAKKAVVVAINSKPAMGAKGLQNNVRNVHPHARKYIDKHPIPAGEKKILVTSSNGITIHTSSNSNAGISANVVKAIKKT